MFGAKTSEKARQCVSLPIGRAAGDIRAVNARMGRALSLTNVVYDLDANGVIDLKDVSAPKARAGRVTP